MFPWSHIWYICLKEVHKIKIIFLHGRLFLVRWQYTSAMSHSQPLHSCAQRSNSLYTSCTEVCTFLFTSRDITFSAWTYSKCTYHPTINFFFFQCYETTAFGSKCTCVCVSYVCICNVLQNEFRLNGHYAMVKDRRIKCGHALLKYKQNK